MSSIAEIPPTLAVLLQVATNVFPSRQQSFASPTHLRIATTLTTSLRHLVDIPAEATLDTATFILRDSSPSGSPFRTNPFDPALQHRNKADNINDFYRSTLKEEGGDDIQQVGFVDPVKVSRGVQERLSGMAQLAADYTDAEL